MTDEEQEARAMKWERGGSVHLRQLSTGRWAMYPAGGVGSPFWIGPAEGIVAAYAQRPAPTQFASPVKAPRQVAGLDVSKLDFNI